MKYGPRFDFKDSMKIHKKAKILIALSTLSVIPMFLFQNMTTFDVDEINDSDQRSGHIVYANMNAEGTARIQNPTLCSPRIGAGGNYIGQDGKILNGKCVGAVKAPEILGPRAYQKYVSFKTDATKSNHINARDRVELAYTPMIPFGQQIFIGFRIMIPGSSAITYDSFFPLQLWQCEEAGPIAGLRIARTTSHQLQFMTSNDANPSGATYGSFLMKKGVWHQILLSVNIATSGNSTIKVYVDGALYDQITAPIGYNTTKCVDDQHFRVKYGIYKGHEPSAKFEVNFDDMRITNRYHSASPF